MNDGISYCFHIRQSPTLWQNSAIMDFSLAEPLLLLADAFSGPEPAQIVLQEHCRDYHERGFDVSDELRLK